MRHIAGFMYEEDTNPWTGLAIGELEVIDGDSSVFILVCKGDEETDVAVNGTSILSEAKNLLAAEEIDSIGEYIGELLEESEECYSYLEEDIEDGEEVPFIDSAFYEEILKTEELMEKEEEDQ